MTFKVIAEADAKREWNEAVDWYEDCEVGVGLRFDDELRTLSTFHAPNSQSQSAIAVASFGLFHYQHGTSRGQSVGHLARRAESGGIAATAEMKSPRAFRSRCGSCAARSAGFF
jgi:hypothetical protein